MIFTRVVFSLVVGLTLVAFGPVAVCAESGHDGGDSLESVEEVQHSEEEVNTNPLELQTDLAIWTGVVFLLLMAVLWKFAWGPIAQGLQRREQGIADQISQAEQANREAKDLLGQYEQKLAGAKAEVREMMEKARRNAEQAGREMIDKAQAEAKIEQQRALQQIDAATAAALKELADKSATLAVELAGKIIQAELKPKDHTRLIQQAVADFARRSPSEN